MPTPSNLTQADEQRLESLEATVAALTEHTGYTPPKPPEPPPLTSEQQAKLDAMRPYLTDAQLADAEARMRADNAGA